MKHNLKQPPKVSSNYPPVIMIDNISNHLNLHLNSTSINIKKTKYVLKSTSKLQTFRLIKNVSITIQYEIYVHKIPTSVNY